MSPRLLDSDILVDVLRQHPPAVAWFASLSDIPLVCGLAVMEVIQGCRNAAEVRAVLRLVQPLTRVWPTTADSDRALDDFATFHRSHSLGLLDALIAACAVGLDATLCTFNVKHYGVIANLTTEQPYQR